LDCGRLDRSDHRFVAGEMDKSLGQTIVIINQPGASGSIGTRSALEATKDGYTWTLGAGQLRANAWIVWTAASRHKRTFL
jgi:tripartite-type tricarboxylate transporter receptor subunit TctC